MILTRIIFFKIEFFNYLGVSQNFARKYKIPIDQLGFEFDFLKETEDELTKPADGAYIKVNLNS